VGVGGGEGVNVGAAATVGIKGLVVDNIVEPTDGVGRAGTPSLHPARQSKINIKRTLEHLPVRPLLREDKRIAN
jgi:hypothetical protein